MMNPKRCVFWVLGCICLVVQSTTTYAQGTPVAVDSARVNSKALQTIKGIVIDKAQRTPISGASIAVTGGGRGTVADADGRFEIKALPNSWLKFTMLGYQTVNVQARSGEIHVEMELATRDLEEAVVVGYGTQKKELLTASVVNMKFDDIKRNTPTTSVGNLLAGQLTGVRISTPSGVPGNQPGIVIRTGSTFNSSGNNQPVLFVIDGKISGSGDFNNLSPNDIDNITVLKDAASAAAYGARAAGGVVVVTTRTGKTGKTSIQYSFNTGVDKRTKNAPLTTAVQTGELYNRINPNSDPAGWKWAKSDLDYFRNINNGWGYDQLGEIWQDPSTTTHNLSASGGTEKVRYFVGGSYVNQNSFIRNLSYKKYNLRANITADITDRLQLFTGLTVNNNKRYSPPTDASFNDWYGKLRIWQPDQPVWSGGGNPIDYGWIMNMGAQVRGDGGYYNSDGLKPVLNLKLTYKIPGIEGLSAVAQFNKSYTNNRDKWFQKQYDLWVMKKDGQHIISTNDADLLSLKRSNQIGKNYIQESYSWSNDYQLNFQLNYERTFNKVHHVKGWLLYEKAEAQVGGISAGRENFPVYLTDQWWAASGDRADSYASGTTNITTGRKSWVGQLFYDYDSKYMITASYRYDGSMIFAPDKRWGLFPSVSAGWIISKENFFRNIKSIDMLKLRASAGLTSADNITGWQWQQSYSAANSAYLGTGGGTNVGITYGNIINPNVTWEKTLNYNAGVDIDFLKNFNASAEYYFVKTYDILGSRIQTIPPTFARSMPAENYGEVHAQGVEASIGYRNSSGHFNYYANILGSYGGATYVIRDQNVTYPYQDQIGRSTTQIVTRIADRILRTQADVDAFVAQNPNYKYYGFAPAVGQIVYKDLSGPNGKPDGMIDDWDQQVVKKNNNPIVIGANLGLEWKGITIDATFSGNLHQWRFYNDLANGVEWNRMWTKWYTDGWTPDNPNGSLPWRYSTNDGTRRVNNDNSTFWLVKADFLRLRFLNIGYNLPGSLVNRIGFKGLRCYFSGTNLFVISKFNKDYYDPEMGSNTAFPVMKNFNFGVNVTL